MFIEEWSSLAVCQIVVTILIIWNFVPTQKFNFLPHLAKVADCCPLLEDLDVTGSFGITNLGVQWFCTGTYNPNHMYHGAPGNLLKKS